MCAQKKVCSGRCVPSFLSSDAPLNDLVLQQAALSKLLIFGAGATVVGIGIDADAATGGEDADNLDIFGVHQADKILHDGVHTVLMEVTVVAEGEEVELQTLRLHHPAAGDIEDLDLSKVGLTRDGTERRELGAVELHPVVVVRMTVLKSLQHLRGIVHPVFGLTAKGLQALFLSLLAHIQFKFNLKILYTIPLS